VTLNAAVPYTVRNSNVSIILTNGKNNIAFGSTAGILCRDESNITIDGSDNGRLSSSSSGSGPGIGTDQSCGTLRFIGGRISASSYQGTGIGISNPTGSSASLKAIVFENAQVTAGSQYGVGIGCDVWATGSNCWVGEISAVDSTLNLQGDCGLGTGGIDAFQMARLGGIRLES
jgi:hypothetical protein